jgi:hypothetical protein
MQTNRIKSFLNASPPAVGFVPTGFTVCQLPQFIQSPLALQLLAQQQAYEQALLAAREEALRLAFSRLQMSLN